jgi:hypothetical protein
MKKTIAILLMVVLILSLSGCEGNVSRVNIIDVDSEIYSKSEINDAIDIVLKHFKDYFRNARRPASLFRRKSRRKIVYYHVGRYY